LNVVNRHRDQTIETELEIQDKQFAGPVEIVHVNGPDIKSENNFDSTPVRPAQQTLSANGHKLRHSFAPHSYTMLKAKLV
jgi:alpha-L-arabinofuranosidase